MAKFTKGEWKVDRVGNEGKYCIHTGDMSLAFAHTFPNRYRRPQVSSEEAEANAHLIASAPAMYQKLIKIKKWLTMLLDNAQEHLKTERFITLKEAYEHDIKNYQSTIADIDKALALAEGKEGHHERT